MSKLSYLTFNTSHPGVYRKECENSYGLWKAQWLETFSSLDKTRTLNSDEFLDRELSGLFEGEKPIGFTLVKFIDLSFASTLDILYFKNYPEELTEQNKFLQDRIMIMSFMTLRPDWRKSQTNFSISELLLGFMILRLNISNSNRALACIRNDRSINKVFYRHSGRFLLKGTAYNVEVDYAEADTLTSTLSSYSSHALLCFKLWSEFYNQRRKKRHDLERRITPRQDEQASRRVPQPTLDQ
ncbi:MAG: hypothetical protein H7256_00525 [Bdellovibrio sp.]|nr:hypothetical protein [Bdellovibrio sp.]